MVRDGQCYIILDKKAETIFYPKYCIRVFDLFVAWFSVLGTNGGFGSIKYGQNVVISHVTCAHPNGNTSYKRIFNRPY